MPTRLAALISGGGTTLLNLLDRIDAGQLDAEVVLVVSSRGDASGLPRIRRRSPTLPVRVLGRAEESDARRRSELIFRNCRDVGAELVCLCGYLSLLHVADDFTGRVMNIHPSLLPSFGGTGMYGRRVHEAVLQRGCKVSGCTVHLCDDSYDTGPILIQRCCRVEDADTPATLAARVFEQECEAYPEAIRAWQKERVAADRGARHPPPLKR